MKTRLLFLLILSYATVRSVEGQLPYTTDNFGFTVESNIVYGTAVDYAGMTDTLLLDVYKPTGDSNCRRPLLVLVHGGAWIAGSKNDGGIVAIAQKMAQKGYVVGAINYRLGTHKTNNYTMYWACNNTLSQPCGYIADSSEVVRAIYRGMQDAKGAVRFMKSRYLTDSTDIENTFIGGESAGAFIAMAAAFYDDPSEKPADAGAMADAVTPDADLVNCLPTGYSLQRPDLGSIEGALHTGTYNAKVKGVGSIYGGLLDLSVLQQNADTPVVYMYHQGSDVVVHYNYGRLLGRTSAECYDGFGNVCQPYYYYPRAFGGEGIRQHFVSQSFPTGNYVADIINNYSYGNDCFANGHSIDNPALRTQNMANLFATVISASGNVPSATCLPAGTNESEKTRMRIWPNPVKGGILFISTQPDADRISILDLQGRLLSEMDVSGNVHQINTNEIPAGIYFIVISGDGNRAVEKVVIQ